MWVRLVLVDELVVAFEDAAVEEEDVAKMLLGVEG